MAGFEQVNGKVVKIGVQPGATVLGKRGAMLGYTGEVRFSPASMGQGAGPGSAGGGMGAAAGLLGRAMSGENAPLMAAEGSGEVYYGHAGLHVHVVRLDGSDPLSVESDRLLAFPSTMQVSTVFLGSQGGIRGAVRGALTGQGLFTTQLTGVGEVAVLAHGGVLALPVQQGPVVVDPQAYVGHTGRLTLDVSANLGWKDARSGEAIQLKATGTGTVLVQASEQKL